MTNRDDDERPSAWPSDEDIAAEFFDALPGPETWFNLPQAYRDDWTSAVTRIVRPVIYATWLRGESDCNREFRLRDKAESDRADAERLSRTLRERLDAATGRAEAAEARAQRAEQERGEARRKHDGAAGNCDGTPPTESDAAKLAREMRDGSARFVDAAPPPERVTPTADAIDAEALPPGTLAALARVLRYGAAKHGCAPHETGGGQTVTDHLIHAERHLRRAVLDDEARDSDTGQLDLIHAAARCLLAAGLAGRVETEPTP